MSKELTIERVLVSLLNKLNTMSFFTNDIYLMTYGSFVRVFCPVMINHETNIIHGVEFTCNGHYVSESYCKYFSFSLNQLHIRKFESKELLKSYLENLVYLG